MNETTNLNTELLSADARGRKHIPFAVFAVILIHIILFLVLLIAAGCRAKARAKRLEKAGSQMLAQQSPAPRLNSAPLSTLRTTNTVPPITPLPQIMPAATPPLIQPIVVTEPPMEKQNTPPSPARKAAQKSSPAPTQRPTAANSHKAKIYVVKAGDTVEKIAKMHRTSVQAIKAENNLKDFMLRPGQQLRVSSQKAKSSNEV